MSIEGLPLPPLCGDNVLVNPYVFPVVAYILGVVGSVGDASECSTCTAVWLEQLKPLETLVQIGR